MFGIVEKKACKLQNSDYEKYTENFLLIYDNLFLPMVDKTLASDMLE